MKIVINKCFGTFGISYRCLYLMIELGSSSIQSMSVNEFFGSPIPEGDIKDDLPLGWLWSFKTGVLVNTKKNTVYYYNDELSLRCDPILVELIEKYGSQWASGSFGELKVVEIDNDVKWEIQDYDGKEKVSEIHRTWE